jgi:hypothetical protein
MFPADEGKINHMYFSINILYADCGHYLISFIVRVYRVSQRCSLAAAVVCARPAGRRAPWVVVCAFVPPYMCLSRCEK